MSGGGGGGSPQVIGYRYYFGLHMGIGRGPVDELLQIKVGDRVAWQGSVTSTSQIQIDNVGLFGGDKGEGGIQGPFDVMMGEPNQVPSDGMTKMLSAPVPGFRGMFTGFFNGLVSAINPYPKAWAFKLRRILKGWDGPVWEPTLAVIPLVKPVTPGETSQTPQPVTETVEEFKSYEPYEVVNNQITINVPRGDISPTTVVTVSWKDANQEYQGVPEFDPNNPSDVGTRRWELNGHTITFYPQGNPWDDAGILYVSYFYAYEVTTEPPADSGSNEGEVVIKAMNPAHIIYQCLTDRVWGRGLDRSEIDDVSFKEAAQILYNEGFGLCMKWSRTDSIESFVQTVIDHIGAVLFVSRTSMLMTLRLIRGGYIVDELPLFDADSGLIKITQAAVAGIGPIVNEVQVTFHDPVTDTDGAVRAQNIALKQAANGVVNAQKKSYPGIPIYTLAGRVAQRDLRAAGPGLRRFSLVFDRRGYKIEPGSVIRIRDLVRGIKETIVRVARVEDGTLQSGQITVTGVQDVFGFPSRSNVGREPGGWTPPNRRPCVGRHAVFEMPYAILARTRSAADFAAIDPTSAFLGTLQEQGQALNNGYRIAVKDGTHDSSENPSNTTWLCSI